MYFGYLTVNEIVLLLTCIFRWWQVPYFWAGIKAYDIVSGRQLLKWSHYVGKKKTLELFPMLKEQNLCGSIIYYDGEGCSHEVSCLRG